MRALIIATILPVGIASADTLYVSDFSTSKIQQFAPNGIGSTFVMTSGQPTGIAFDSSGNLYVAIDSPSRQEIDKVAPNGTTSVFATTGLSSPEAIAFDAFGNLYVANAGNTTIEKFTPGGVGSVFADEASGLNGPIGLAFDSAGNLYVSNQFGGPTNDGTIMKFAANGNGTLNGNGTVFAQTGLSNPYGLAFDSLGRLYVTNFHDNTIEEFTPAGIGSLFANNNLSQPVGLAIDGHGNVYATNRNGPTGYIEEFSSDGTALQSFITDGTPVFIQAVPEMSTFVCPSLAVGWLIALRLRAVNLCSAVRNHRTMRSAMFATLATLTVVF